MPLVFLPKAEPAGEHKLRGHPGAIREVIRHLPPAPAQLTLPQAPHGSGWSDRECGPWFQPRGSHQAELR